MCRMKDRGEGAAGERGHIDQGAGDVTYNRQTDFGLLSEVGNQLPMKPLSSAPP